MTTRAAGKAVSAVGTDSTGTSEASGSRRSSLNDSHNQADDAEIDRDQHAPSSTQSSESAEAEDERQQRRDADRDTMDVDVPGAPDSDTSSQDHDQESLDTSKNGNKRKRSSATDDLSQQQPHTNGINGNSSPDDADPPPPPTNHPHPEPPRKRARGGWRGRGRGRGRGGRGGLTLSTHASFQTDATSTPPSAGLPDRDHLSDDQQGSERPTKQPKRLPGRRRAPNADPSVEADLRRQLQLKTAYRAVVKVLKPVLAELADRAINDVEEDPKAHEQSDQYEVVKAALDARLAERIAYLDRKLAISKEHVERRKTAELEIVNTAYESVFSNVREDYLIRCQYQLLTILREAEKQTQDGYATDDEDGLVPRRRGMQYKWKPQGFLDPKSDSRSRFFLETDKLWKDHLLRETSKKERGEYLDKNSEEFDKTAVNSRENFATYDADRREYAMAVYNANSLAKAAEAVENGTAPPVVKTLPNEDATGLQLLRSSEGNFDA
ncbi:loc733926 protein [Neofusicoccum parvum]|uniref:Loc733926 protein n=1 Tax=Neofusicoccum parvum TaxID=310453 RepID=A0ACB5S2U0_9PEZI|nr:loc733926 protein [Neofusicoccum parvum]